MLKKIILLTLFILVLFSNLAIAGNPAIITLYNGKFPVSVIVDDYSGKSPTERDVLKAQYQLEFNICSKLGITIRNLGGGFYDLRSGRRGVSPEQDAVRLILEGSNEAVIRSFFKSNVSFTTFLDKLEKGREKISKLAKSYPSAQTISDYIEKLLPNPNKEKQVKNEQLGTFIKLASELNFDIAISDQVFDKISKMDYVTPKTWELFYNLMREEYAKKHYCVLCSSITSLLYSETEMPKEIWKITIELLELEGLDKDLKLKLAEAIFSESNQVVPSELVSLFSNIKKILTDQDLTIKWEMTLRDLKEFPTISEISAKTSNTINLKAKQDDITEVTKTIISKNVEMKKKYKAIKVLADLLYPQEINNSNTTPAELFVLRLTLEEARNIMKTGVTPAEFYPNYKEEEKDNMATDFNTLQVVLNDILEKVVNTQGNEKNTAKDMIEYSEKVFKDASDAKLFRKMFGNIERIKELVGRIEKF